MTTEDIDVIRGLASRSTAGEGEVGVVDPLLDPVEWFRTCMGRRTEEGRDLFCVSVPSVTFPGEGMFLLAVTGNGPDSEANAEFFAIARRAVLALTDEVTSLRSQLNTSERHP